MPTIVIMFGVTTLLLLAVFQYIATTANLTSEVIYRQVALTAARGALDYGKEQFDSNLAFDGTKDGSGNPAELTMFTNNKYKVTYQVIVLETSADGRTKRVQGIGRVYLPATAATARYSRTINGEIIRSQIIQQDPSDFNPLAWYDASCNNATSNDPVCDTDTVLMTSSASPAANPTSLREERNNGNYCNGSPQTTPPSNNQLDITRHGECGSSNQTHIGFMFNFGAGLPKGATVTNARLRLTSNAADSTAITVTAKGIDADNYPNFTTSSSSQINGAARTGATTNWALPTWSTVNQTADSPNLAAIVQEIIDRPGWAQGNNIGLVLEHATGSGRRRAKITQITLTVTYTGATVPANSAGDLVKTWRDRSGNGFDMTATDPARPIKGAISQPPAGTAPNDKPMISFTANSSWMNATVPLSTGRTANNYTALAVMRVKGGTTTDGAATLVGFYGSGTGNVRYSPFWRHPNQGFHSYDAGAGTGNNSLCAVRTTTERQCKDYGSTISSAPSWTLWSAREALTERDVIMRRNGTNPTAGQSKFFDPITLNAPYNIVLGANAQTLAPNSEVEFAEIILYDRQLTCPQIESLELYLANKWGFTDGALLTADRYSSQGCTENNIPAY